MAYINRDQKIEAAAAELAMHARCQRVVSPSCSTVCQTCKDAHKSHSERRIRLDIDKAKELLEQWGYSIAE